ncbi:MAG: CRISPR-associated endoribonuclease Cas6 [Thermonemataceae bacterium]
MEFKMTIARLQGRSLPFNYQYPLASWIYKVIAQSDKQYAHFLHQKGHIMEGKHFKLFTFSNLTISPFKVKGDRLLILGDEVTLRIRFLVNSSMEHFIKGLFLAQQFTLGDRKSQVRFQVINVETQPAPVFMPVMRYSNSSPVCISSKEEEERYVQYLTPLQTDFGKLLLVNLLNKQVASTIGNVTPHEIDNYHFKLLNKPVSKLITIKSGTAAETKVRGYLFDFEITLPVTLHQIGYYAGFGEKNSMGFGCVKVASSLISKQKMAFSENQKVH